MPFGDGTGPAGAGPMTGRAAGFCAGYPMPGYANPVGGRGMGMGRGRGGGWGRGRGFGWGRAGYGYPAWGQPDAYPYAPYPAPAGPAIQPEQELAALKQQAEYFGDALGEIKERIEQLESQKSSKE